MIISPIKNINLYPVFKGKQDLSQYCKIDNKGLDKDRFEYIRKQTASIPKKAAATLGVDEKTPCIDFKKLDTPERIYLKGVNSEPLKNRCSKMFEEYLPVIERFKNIEVNSDVNLLEGINDRDFDLSLLMEIAISNSLRKDGNAYVFGEKTPALFKGFDKKQVAESITDVLNKIEKYGMFSHQVGKFSIGKKDFYIKYQSGGCVGDVYKICDDEGRCVAVKKYNNSIERPMNNGKTEIAMLRQARKEDVQDVPEFYMAQAADYKLDENKNPYQNPRWMMVEFITLNTPVKPWDKEKHKICPSYMRYFCSRYGLVYGDGKNTNSIGEYRVDMGGYTNQSYYDWEECEWLDREEDDELYEEIQEHIDEFNEYHSFIVNSLKKNSQTIQEIIDSSKHK